MAKHHIFLQVFITLVITHNVLSSVNENEQQMNGAAVQMSMVDSTEKERGSPDVGQLVSCLGVKDETFNVNWTPKILKIGEIVNISGDIITTQAFDHGKVCIQIWLEDMPDPIYENCIVGDCDSLKEVVKDIVPQLECPITKGFHLKQVSSFELGANIPLPAGSYKAKVQVWNEDDDLTICFTGTIISED